MSSRRRYFLFSQSIIIWFKIIAFIILTQVQANSVTIFKGAMKKEKENNIDLSILE